MIAIAVALALAGPAPDLPASDELAAGFNAAKGRVRIVMLVSPTCPACISGADRVKADVVDKLKDKRLATFEVFIPMLLGDDKTHALERAKLLEGSGIAPYWDGRRSLGKAYGQAVKLPRGKKVAWDVYFVYGPNATWNATPPVPDYWMHQLGDDERCLDPSKLRAVVQRELKALK